MKCSTVHYGAFFWKVLMIASSCPYNQRLLLYKQITHSNGTFGVADGCRGWKKYKTQTVLQLCVMIVHLGLMSEKKMHMIVET